MARRIQDSIFLKLLFVFAFAGAANVMAFNLFQKYLVFDDVRRNHRYENMVEYARFISTELGEPPSQNKIQALANRLHLQIRVESPAYSLASSPNVPSFSVVDSKMNVKLSGHSSKVGKFRDFLVIEVSEGQKRVLLLLESETTFEDHSELIFELMLVLLSILLGTYLSIRHILAPIRSLSNAVQEVSQGNLEVNIPLAHRKDELGHLLLSFKRMTEQVRDMFRSKEQLLLDVSHEFRSPLARIRVALELGGEDAKSSIRNAVSELDAMIAELLESARLDDSKGKLKLEETDLEFLISDLVARYKNEGPGVLFIPDERHHKVRIDPARIRTALKNLIENALKYSSHQSRPVEISLFESDEEEPSQRPTVSVRVRDFGIGISPEEQPLIFEPFYRIDRSRVKTTGGYGLGLSLCKKIATAHQGDIHVLSIPGRETNFLIEIPR